MFKSLVLQSPRLVLSAFLIIAVIGALGSSGESATEVAAFCLLGLVVVVGSAFVPGGPLSQSDRISSSSEDEARSDTDRGDASPADAGGMEEGSGRREPVGAPARCDDCHSIIDPSASECPACGASLNSRRSLGEAWTRLIGDEDWNRPLVFLAIMALLGIAVIGGALLFPTRQTMELLESVIIGMGVVIPGLFVYLFFWKR